MARSDDPTPRAAPVFRRSLDLRRANRRVEHPFDEAATTAEQAALAALFDATEVAKFKFSGALVPLGSDGWQLKARLVATVVQPCVVTFEPVVTRINIPVTRRYLPDADLTLDVEPDLVEDDDIEPLTAQIDYGAAAVEDAALALPDYPRAKGATLPPIARDDDGQDEERPNPFAALAALKPRDTE